MTKRSVISAALTAMLLLGICAFAQESGKAHQGTKKTLAGVTAELDNLSQQLNLTEDQKAKVGSILEDRHQKIMAVRTDASLSQEDRKARSKEIRQKSFEQIRPLLTADQQKKLDEMPKGRGKGGKQPSKETQ
jgi:Spy/CpxP family protein refolding chaperone